jgi:hypothetical protein
MDQIKQMKAKKKQKISRKTKKLEKLKNLKQHENGIYSSNSLIASPEHSDNQVTKGPRFSFNLSKFTNDFMEHKNVWDDERVKQDYHRYIQESKKLSEMNFKNLYDNEDRKEPTFSLKMGFENEPNTQFDKSYFRKN